ncbi:nuclear pore complex assembly-domain-containing protein [Talaromyces proteolyticus]|uniref:Nuclear pore complex assembly-domain-containing protein n=1 Tax=Talaromyces proteolyticus TaxID=1131652 RepID=A0AAD4KXA0_9EURO|nr:nuclear pore complex assembly-domain-containing protein [Talaromyces proteolyticus]KAH8703240.1 nuclear pore complex assembly-domain-containing protein [Talaromyces proteolyticus]
MASWESFEFTFQFEPNYAHDKKTLDRITANRRSLQNQLFIDRLLKLMGVKSVQEAYPPKTNHALRDLYEKVLASSFPDHQKQAVIYYLLRDCRGSNEALIQLTRECHLPEKYQLFIDGLWHLDRLEFRRALEYLTEPSLIPTFPDEILSVLTQQNLPKHDDSLAIAYYLTVSPPLASEKVQQSYFETLCRANITESFYFARKYDHDRRRQFLEQLVVFVHKTPAGQLRGSRAMELINLPFDELEESWFEECLLNGRAAALSGAKDTVLMRRLASGKMQDLPPSVESLGGRKIDGINWDDLRQSVDSKGFV